MPARIRAAFTLIELLVVITIIVVLLALLTPALDKAIFQAELAVCAARQKAIGSAAVQYTAANTRAYPYRKVINENSGQPNRIITAWRLGGFDDRDMLDGYIGRVTYLDPITPEFDIDQPDPSIGDNLFIGYSIWFDFWYNSAPSQAMKKYGQKFVWHPKIDAPDDVYSFRLISSDLDHIRFDAPLNWSSHPDDRGILRETLFIGAEYTPGGLTGRQFSSWYQSTDSANRRGAVDLNYAYDDGSVRRLENVEWNEWEENGRMVRVPEHNGLATEHPDWHQLPKN